MRIVFMGTPDFARRCLEDLHQSHHEIVAVVTAPDRPAGRGKKMHASAVKEYAVEAGLPLLQPEKLRDPEFLEGLRQSEADIFVVVAFRMLPEVVWSMPAKGTINLHASLLPQYRGAAPIQWALINGEEKTGLTTFFIDAQIDEGAILLQKEISLSPDMTAGKLHDLMLEDAGPLIIRTLDGIERNGLVAREQTKHTATLKMAPKLFKEDGRIDWRQDATQVHNRIRGMSPFPGAWTMVSKDSEKLMLKIYRSALKEVQIPAGEIRLDSNSISIGCGTGSIEVLELQLPGRKRLDAASFLRGIPNFDEWKIDLAESLI